jgi:hypothetical protein
MVDSHAAGVEISRMHDEQSELSGLRDLDPEVISAIHNRYFRLYRCNVSVGDKDIAGYIF